MSLRSDVFQQIVQSKRTAFIAPLAVFMLLTELARWLKVDNAELPWHVRAPELWVYPLQSLICLALLIIWRKHYYFPPWSARVIALAFALAIVGIGVWLLPSALYHWAVIDTDGWRWLGVFDRVEGFDPNAGGERFFWLVVGLRFLRLVVVVPLVEEIFWRGFLMRALIDRPVRSFDKVPFGTFGWRSVIVTTVLFAAVHQPVDWLPALVFGSLMAWLTVQAKSLGACVVMHALTNLILGIYVMQSELWGLW